MQGLFSDFKALQGHIQTRTGTYLSYTLESMEMQEIFVFLIACVLFMVLCYSNEL